MKKYIKPAVKAVNVENENILAGSPSVGFGTGTTTRMDARRRNDDELIFDDEEIDF